MMPTSKESAAAIAPTAANDALAGQAAVAAQQAILARQAAAAAAQRAEFAYLAGLPPNRRTVAQNTRLAVFLSNAPRTQQAGPTALHALSVAVHVIELQRGGTVYRMNDQSDGFYVIVDGRITLYDVKDKDEAEDDDGVVERLCRLDSFGEEDMLSNCRRAHRADVGPDSSAILIRVPTELYRKYLQHLHQPDFEDKVKFLSQLEVFKSLPDETLRKLAPCFSQVELRVREYLVRQSERADSMYAIASGQCSVLVDPSFRPEPGAEPEIDPRKAMQVCLIGPGNIVGDMTVLANVRRRTATILCLTDLICYKIRRATFIRRVPSMQLEALRQVAEAKLRMTERHLHKSVSGSGCLGSGSKAAALRDKLLRGHELRQLVPHANVPHLEFRGLPSGVHNDAVDTLIASSLAAAVAAAACGTNGVMGNTAIGGSAPGSSVLVPSSSTLSVISTSSATVAAVAAVAASTAEARMRFGVGRRAGLSPQSRALMQVAAATSSVMGGTGSSGGTGMASTDRPGTQTTKSAGRTSAALGASLTSSDKVRNADINFSWGLGPGTLINSLLDKGPSADSGITLHRVYANDTREEAIAARQEQSISARGGGGGGDGGGGSGSGGAIVQASVPSPQLPPQLLLPSAAAAQLRPTSSRQHIQHLSFNYGRSGGGFGGPGLRGNSSSMTLVQPRWGWTSSPIDASYSPYTAPSSFGTTASGTAFSVVGISVNGGPDGNTVFAIGSGGVTGNSGSGGHRGSAGGTATGPGSRRGGVRSAPNSEKSSAALPNINGDKVQLVQEQSGTCRRSFSGGLTVAGSNSAGMPQYMGIQRPGPLIIGAAAPAGIPPPQQPSLSSSSSVMLVPQPGVSSESGSSPQPWPAQGLTSALQQLQKHRSGSGSGDASRLGSVKCGSTEVTGDAPEGGTAAATPQAQEAPTSPTSNPSSPARSRYGDASLQQDQRWARGHVSRGPSVNMCRGGSAVVASGEEDVGSDLECPTPTRRDGARRTKSMGKARFSRQLVTQNSSVDTLVAEAIINALTKDMLQAQMQGVDGAIHREEEEVACEGTPQVADMGVAHEAAVDTAAADAAQADTVKADATVADGSGADVPIGSNSPVDACMVSGEAVEGVGKATGVKVGTETDKDGDGDVGKDGDGSEEPGPTAGTVEGTDCAGNIGAEASRAPDVSEYEREGAESSSAVGATVGTHESPTGDDTSGMVGPSGEAAPVGEVEGVAAQAMEDAPTVRGDGNPADVTEADADRFGVLTGAEAAVANKVASEPVAAEDISEDEGAANTLPQDAGKEAAVEASAEAAAAPSAVGEATGSTEAVVEGEEFSSSDSQGEANATAPADGEGAIETTSAPVEGDAGCEGGNKDATSFPALQRESWPASEGSKASMDSDSPATPEVPETFVVDVDGTLEADSMQAHQQQPSRSASQEQSTSASSGPLRSMSGVFARATAAAAAAAAPVGDDEAQLQPTSQPQLHSQPITSVVVSPRLPSRQPPMLQLGIPDAMASALYSRSSSVSPNWRQVPSSIAPRPYPYVGPFLSLKKGPLLPVNLMPPPPPPPAAQTNKTPSFTLRGSSPASQATPPVNTPIPAPASVAAQLSVSTLAYGAVGGGLPPAIASTAATAATAAAAAAMAHVNREFHPGQSLGRNPADGLRSISALIAGGGNGGGAGGFHAGGGSSGTRGQLRKGGALYHPPTVSRNGSLVL